MGSSQRESGICVAECRGGPARRIMANSAIVVEIIGDMVGIADSVECRLMAGIAIVGRILVAVGVASDTLQGNMSPSQRESGICVAECRGGPARSVMANSAIVIKIIGDMVGVGHSIEICMVAGIAVIWSILIPSAMAGLALQNGMCAS